MTWGMQVFSLAAIVALVILATTVRDYLQSDLAHRRKLKSSGARTGNRILLVVLFPLTLYLLLGTLLLALLSVMEISTQKLRHYAGHEHVEVIAWHEVSVFLTLLFPLEWPTVALMVGLVFIGAVFSAILQAAIKALKVVLRFVRRVWVIVAHAVQTLLEWFMDGLGSVWDMVVVGTQTIWDLIVDATQTASELVLNKTQMILEQLKALIHEIWATINARTRL